MLVNYPFLTLFLRFSYAFLTLFLRFSYAFLTLFLTLFLTFFLPFSYPFLTRFLPVSYLFLTFFLRFSNLFQKYDVSEGGEGFFGKFLIKNRDFEIPKSQKKFEFSKKSENFAKTLSPTFTHIIFLKKCRKA